MPKLKSKSKRPPGKPPARTEPVTPTHDRILAAANRVRCQVYQLALHPDVPAVIGALNGQGLTAADLTPGNLRRAERSECEANAAIFDRWAADNAAGRGPLTVLERHPVLDPDLNPTHPLHRRRIEAAAAVEDEEPEAVTLFG